MRRTTNTLLLQKKVNLAVKPKLHKNRVISFHSDDRPTAHWSYVSETSRVDETHLPSCFSTRTGRLSKKNAHMRLCVTNKVSWIQRLYFTIKQSGLHGEMLRHMFRGLGDHDLYYNLFLMSCLGKKLLVLLAMQNICLNVFWKIFVKRLSRLIL